MAARPPDTLARLVRERGRAVLAKAREVVSKDIGPEALRMMKERTARGVSSRGTRFKPYAASTAKRKGRTQPVTLRDTGAMLDALVYDPAKGRIYLRDRAQQTKARYHEQGTRHMPSRPFVGLTLREGRALFQRFAVKMRSVSRADRRTTIKVEFFR